MTCGVPQGSVLGPLLFNLIMDDLSSDLAASGIEHAFYADDLTLINIGSIASSTSVLQHGLDILSNWCNRYYMEVNASKTVSTVFNTKGSSPPITLTYRGVNLKHEPNPKLLGVTFQNSKGFARHADSIHNATELPLLRISAISDTRWGGHTPILRCFALALVDTRLLYASPAWWGPPPRTHPNQSSKARSRCPHHDEKRRRPCRS